MLLSFQLCKTSGHLQHLKINLYCNAESIKEAECEDNLARNRKTLSNHKVESIKSVMIADNNGKNRGNSHDNNKTSIKAERKDKKTPVTPKCSFSRENIDLLFSLIFSEISSILSLIFSGISLIFSLIFSGVSSIFSQFVILFYSNVFFLIFLNKLKINL